MSLPLNVVVLAAGQGKRMHSVLPKVLQPLAGRPLLGHVLAAVRSLEVARVCVVYGHGGEQVRSAFKNEALSWALQEPQLGTGHAVMQAAPHLDDGARALVLYGDVPLTSPDTLRRLADTAGDDALALLTVNLPDPTGYGRIVRNDAGAVERIVEEKDATPEERRIVEVNTGILVAPVVRLKGWLQRIGNHNAQGEYYLTDIIALAVADGVPVRTVQPVAEWETSGVNDKLQLAELERIHQREQARALMLAGVTVIDPSRLDIRGSVSCGRDVEIDVGCVLEGRVELGDGVKLGPYCVLRNAKLAAGTRLAAYSHIEDAETGPDCRIGPFSRLRPGTVLARDVHVGNFVEIKNSSLADQSKANHLAYVGDATVGQRVNIGAGTITCNYDGANKYRTVIEDDAFIGSDTQLVAPVTVGRGATLGAGTTLTRDAPPEQLTLSRAKQVSIPGWKRPVKQKKD